MSKHTTTSYNRACRVENAYNNLFSRVVNFQMSQAEYLEERRKIETTTDYQRLTSFQHGIMYGLQKVFSDRLTCYKYNCAPLLDHRYLVDGERLNKDDYHKIKDVYRRLPYFRSALCWASTGKVYFESTDVRQQTA